MEATFDLRIAVCAGQRFWHATGTRWKASSRTRLHVLSSTGRDAAHSALSASQTVFLTPLFPSPWTSSSCPRKPLCPYTISCLLSPHSLCTPPTPQAYRHGGRRWCCLVHLGRPRRPPGPGTPLNTCSPYF